MLSDNRLAILWEIKDAANALDQAYKLEAYRNTYFQDLYDDIGLFSVRYADDTDERGASPSVESQALRIIDAKEAYDKRIAKLKTKHDRWQAFLQSLDKNAAELLKTQLKENGKSLDGHIRIVFSRILQQWEKESKAIEIQEEKAAKALARYLRKKHPESFTERPKKRPFLIDGEKVSMTQFDYEWQQQKKEREAQDAQWEQFLYRKSNEKPEVNTVK